MLLLVDIGAHQFCAKLIYSDLDLIRNHHTLISFSGVPLCYNTVSIGICSIVVRFGG